MTTDPTPITTGLFLTWDKLGLLALILGAIPFIAKWAWDRLWKTADEAKAMVERARDDRITEIKNLVERIPHRLDSEIRAIATKMEDGFQKLQGSINAHNVSITQVQSEIMHLKERMEKTEVKVEAIPDLIRDSRHALRNQLTRELIPLMIDQRGGLVAGVKRAAEMELEDDSADPTRRDPKT